MIDLQHWTPSASDWRAYRNMASLIPTETLLAASQWRDYAHLIHRHVTDDAYTRVEAYLIVDEINHDVESLKQRGREMEAADLEKEPANCAKAVRPLVQACIHTRDRVVALVDDLEQLVEGGAAYGPLAERWRCRKIWREEYDQATD